MPNRLLVRLATLCLVAGAALAGSAQESAQLPTGSLTFGPSAGRFDPDGTFYIRGQDWPELNGTWTADGSEIELVMTQGPRECLGPGRYLFARDGGRVSFTLIADECPFRRMILDGSTWRPPGDVAPAPDRRIVLTAAEAPPSLPDTADADGSWPSFRGVEARGVADGENLPDTWEGPSGDNIRWRTSIPGLGHSSPVVWGAQVFVTTAVSTDPDATFRPGLYGDGDASADRSSQRWMILALDTETGDLIWERVAHAGAPVDKRHIKSTYASSTPATDGRIVVAAFGSQGVHAYDVHGAFLWKVDVGQVHLVPTTSRRSSGDRPAPR